ncbi:unnamed protein product [Heligmosomoides polygyrus]|uniref:COesterase domain-containing protein n=1 Tax=Heligmosomoides polygyrus TaxID=6339 RepID=A0A183FYL0_HELPZ|nr:unnamed protein product [Heligmosomoides polygyrus]
MGQSSSAHRAISDSRVVKTKYGKVLGRRFEFEGKQVDAFQGVPYASPPLGELRFKRPEPPASWDGVKETKAFAARGIQKDAFFFEKTSEDNLYLNVFTPAWSPCTTSGFAVLVFIHGGGFVSDSTVKYGDVGICEHLCTKDVVVVTAQYRLGYLGFFTTGDECCPGNLALWDQTFALKWIKENIAYFNGDPDNVTVMGQSAGGASVDLLSISPYSRDLFHRVIPMGGNASCSWALHNDMVEECRKFAEKNGVKDTRDSKKVAARHRFVAYCFGLDVFISVSEMRKEAPAKPMMIGCCSSEGLILCKFGDTVRYMVSASSILLDLVSRPSFQLLGDKFTNIGVQTAVLETLEANNAPVYFYSFDYFNPKSWGPLSLRWPFKDATHCTELAYIFAVGIIWNFEFNDTDKRMLELTTRMWTNFAKYGEKIGDLLSKWPNSSPETPDGVPFHFIKRVSAHISTPLKNFQLNIFSC